jgi:hypothetical protein
MPSILHEALVQMFRDRPSLAPELLTGALGIDLPEYEEVHLEPSDSNNLVPTEYLADAVVVMTAADKKPVLAVVVEVQLRWDPDKVWTWPVYLATHRARRRCGAVLLVVCVNAKTARSCARPIDLAHPGWVLAPVVLRPDRVPLVTDAKQAIEAPELAVLSAMAHRRHPDVRKVLDVLLDALAGVDEERVTLYSDVVLAALSAAGRRYLEGLMTARTYEYQSDFVRRYVFQGRVEGEAKGEARAVLAVLDARGIDVPDDARARIVGCSDLDRLEAWVRRAVTVRSVDDLFD